MKTIILALATLLGLSSAVDAQSSGRPRGLFGAPYAPLTYTGPGDVVTTAKAMYALRAYDRASVGTRAIQIQRASDAATLVVNTLRSGHLDAATAATFCAATTCTVTVWYDQTGNGFDVDCSGCVAVQVSELKFACAPNGDPCADTKGAASDSNGTQGYLSATTFTPASTATMTGVWNDYSINAGALGYLYAANMDMIFTYTGNRPDLTTISATRAIGGACDGHNCYLLETFCGIAGPLKSEVVVTTATWHTALGECNGAASIVALDGVEKTGEAGSGPYSSGQKMHVNYMAFEVGRYSVEMGYWDGLLMDGTQRAAMRANQTAFWGF